MGSFVQWKTIVFVKLFWKIRSFSKIRSVFSSLFERFKSYVLKNDRCFISLNDPNGSIPALTKNLVHSQKLRSFTKTTWPSVIFEYLSHNINWKFLIPLPPLSKTDFPPLEHWWVKNRNLEDELTETE